MPRGLLYVAIVGVGWKEQAAWVAGGLVRLLWLRLRLQPRSFGRADRVPSRAARRGSLWRITPTGAFMTAAGPSPGGNTVASS